MSPHNYLIFAIEVIKHLYKGIPHLMAIRDPEEDFCSIFENPFIVRIPDKMKNIEKNAFKK